MSASWPDLLLAPAPEPGPRSCGGRVTCIRCRVGHVGVLVPRHVRNAAKRPADHEHGGVLGQQRDPRHGGACGPPGHADAGLDERVVCGGCPSRRRRWRSSVSKMPYTRTHPRSPRPPRGGGGSGGDGSSRRVEAARRRAMRGAARAGAEARQQAAVRDMRRVERGGGARAVRARARAVRSSSSSRWRPAQQRAGAAGGSEQRSARRWRRRRRRARARREEPSQA